MPAAATEPAPNRAEDFNPAMLSQTAHPYAEVVTLVRVESAVPSADIERITANTLAALIESQPASHEAHSPLQVWGIGVSEAGLHVRFNRAIDVVRLRSGHPVGEPLTSDNVLVLRDNVPVRGTLVLDPDGEGFVFVADVGGLSAGEYTVILRSRAEGFVTPDGELLDGDYDGKAGGDYRARFVLTPSALRLSLAGALGGLATWAAIPGAIDGGPLRRALDAGRRRSNRPADPASIRIDRQTKPSTSSRAPRAPAWLSRWLGSREAASNDWRVRP